jgi:hypothetical protein
MIASTGSKIVSISRIPVSLIVSRIEALIASTASDDCKRLHLEVAGAKLPRAIQLLEDADRAERKTEAAGLTIIILPGSGPDTRGRSKSLI